MLAFAASWHLWNARRASSLGRQRTGAPDRGGRPTRGRGERGQRRRTRAGRGRVGTELGFAPKDILSNFFSGLLILVLRPFEIGDQIIIDGTEGSVERIDLRATQIRTYDGRQMSAPNADTFVSRVANNTAAPVRRASVEFFVAYEVRLDAVARLSYATACATEGVLPEPPPSLRVRELHKDCVRLELRFRADSRRSDFVLTASRVRAMLLDVLKRKQVPLPQDTIALWPAVADAAVAAASAGTHSSG